MRWWAPLALVVTLSAEAQWVPPPTARPTATRRPTAPPPRPTSTPSSPVTYTPSPRPTPTSGACPPAYAREFTFVPGIPLNAPLPGEPLRFADGGEFLVLVRFASAGEIPFRLVRVK